MKSPTLVAFFVAITTGFVAGLPRPSSAEECTGPFRECALSVSAQCSRDADGQQRMTYYSRQAATFETCVGRIFEAAGHPNPYKTGAAVYGDLSVPLSEVITPASEP